jgi:hypothetical protein
VAEHCESKYVVRAGEAAPLDWSGRPSDTRLYAYQQLLAAEDPEPTRVALRDRLAAWWSRTQLRLRIIS